MNARFASLLLLLGMLAVTGVACGSATIKPGGSGGAAGKGGAGGACVLDSTQLDHCTLQ